MALFYIGTYNCGNHFAGKQLCGVPEKLHDIRLLHTDFCNYIDAIINV